MPTNALFHYQRHLRSDLHTSVAWAGISGDLPVEVVLDHDNLLAAIWVSPQHSLDCCVGGLAFAASDVPPRIKYTVD